MTIKIKSQFGPGNIRAARQGLKNMANVEDRLKGLKAKISISDVDSTALTKHNFFCRFEKWLLCEN